MGTNIKVLADFYENIKCLDPIDVRYDLGRTCTRPKIFPVKYLGALQRTPKLAMNTMSFVKEVNVLPVTSAPKGSTSQM